VCQHSAASARSTGPCPQQADSCKNCGAFAALIPSLALQVYQQNKWLAKKKKAEAEARDLATAVA
jgi:hypothetical protein